MKKWEHILQALDHPDRAVRARTMFELMEQERRDAVESFKDYAMVGIVKTAVARHFRDQEDKKDEPCKPGSKE